MARVGDRISEYLLEERIGSGGFGEVWRARHEHLPKTVAVKLPHSPDDLRTIESEGLAQHGLRHPGIVRTLGLSLDAEQPYVVMEYVDGESLRERLERDGRLDPPEARDILTQILEALAVAHAEGVVHGDLKPENVLLERETDRVRLTDFGLARAIRPEGPLRLSHGDSNAASDGVSGTLDYLAPEERRAGQKKTPRSDLYAVGVMAFEMLTGELPDGLDPPSDLRSTLDESWDRFARKSLSARPERRIASAEELLTLLCETAGPSEEPTDETEKPAPEATSGKSVLRKKHLLVSAILGFWMGLLLPFVLEHGRPSPTAENLEKRASKAAGRLADRLAEEGGETVHPTPFLAWDAGRPTERSANLARTTGTTLSARLAEKEAQLRVGSELPALVLKEGSYDLSHPATGDGWFLTGLLDDRHHELDLLVYDRDRELKAWATTRRPGPVSDLARKLTEQIRSRTERLGAFVIVDKRLKTTNADLSGLRTHLLLRLARHRKKGAILAPLPRQVRNVTFEDLKTKSGRRRIQAQLDAQLLCLGEYDDRAGRLSAWIVDLADGTTIAAGMADLSLPTYQPLTGAYLYAADRGRILSSEEVVARQTDNVCDRALGLLYRGRLQKAEALITSNLERSETFQKDMGLNLLRGFLLAFQGDLSEALDYLDRANRSKQTGRERLFLNRLYTVLGLLKAERLYWRGKEKEGIFRSGDAAAYKQALRYIEKIEEQGTAPGFSDDVKAWKARIKAELE